MENLFVWIEEKILDIAMFAATAFVNSACFYRYCQEELPEELNKLRKHD